MALFKQMGLICEDNIVHADMNDVLNLKLGTSQIDYPSNKWADNVAVLGDPLPIKSASGNIAHFEDGADSVPLNSGLFYFTPIQASGTPTPSSPIAINGYTGLNITKTGTNVVDIKAYADWNLSSSYAFLTNCFKANQKAIMCLFDNDTTVDVSGCYLGFVDSSYTAGSPPSTMYKWVLNNGTVSANKVNTASGDVNNILNGLIIYPKNETTYNKIFSRYKVLIQYGETQTATTYEAYTGTIYPVSWTEEGTVYGGYYNSVTGELWKTHDVKTFDYTSDWRYENIQGGNFYVGMGSEYAGTQFGLTNGFLCNLVPPSSTSSATKNTCIISTAKNFNLTIGETLGINTAQGFKDWLENNNVDVQVCAVLATPVLVAVIDPTKIKTFEGVNNIWNDGNGITELEYRTSASSGGGGGIPTFIETVLAEDTNSTGTLDFDGADYHDYELIKCYLKNTATLREFEVLVTPQSLDDMFQYFGNGICFNQYGSNIFAYYDTNASGNWVKGSSDRLICTKVCGLTGQGFSISVTNLYRKQATQSTAQAITTQLDLNDFDFIVASANNNTSDCVPCCYVMSGIVHNESLRNQIPNMANAWANSQEIVITEHEISSYNWFCVDAVKIE